MSPATLHENVIVTPPEPGMCVLACAQCKQLRDLADLEWRRGDDVDGVAAVVCRWCAP